MKTFNRYFLVDTLTESVIGSFDALSPEMAKKIVSETYVANEKLSIGRESHKLLHSRVFIQVPETFDEVLQTCEDSVWQPNMETK